MPNSNLNFGENVIMPLNIWLQSQIAITKAEIKQMEIICGMEAEKSIKIIALIEMERQLAICNRGGNPFE